MIYNIVCQQIFKFFFSCLDGIPTHARKINDSTAQAGTCYTIFERTLSNNSAKTKK